MADNIIRTGKLNIIETGSLVKFEVDGTVRFIINNSTGAITAGASDGTAANPISVTSLFGALAELTTGVQFITTSGITPTNNKAMIYLKGTKLIFTLRASSTNYWYYIDLASGADITQLTYSATEP